MSKTVVRRALFKSFWAVIGLLIAVSLFKLAFTGSTQNADGAPLTPTGQIPPEEVVAEKGTISNSLTIDGTIVIDKPVSATSSVTGVLAHRFAESGTKVEKGDKLFQVRTEEEPAEVAEPVEEPADEPGSVDDARGDGDRDDAPAEPSTPKPVYHWYTVVAPATGIVGNYAVDMLGEVAEDGVVVSIRPTTFHAVGAISPLDRYRLAGNPEKATVTIEGGPKPFACTDLSIGDAATETITSDAPEGEMMEGEPGGGEGESGAGARISCLVPRKVTVFDGLTMSMVIDAGKSDGDVVTIPVTAVTGLVRDGSVWVVGEDGNPTEQPVKLGVTDGKVVEVTSGLEAGDSVLRYVPGAKDSPDEMAGDMPEGEM